MACCKTFTPISRFMRLGDDASPLPAAFFPPAATEFDVETLVGRSNRFTFAGSSRYTLKPEMVQHDDLY